jgi:hypothetical protein
MSAKHRVVTYRPPKPVEPAGAAEAHAGPTWDGTRTRLTISNTTMLRGGWDDEGRPTAPVLVGPGESAEFLCAEVDGEWVGPEARHVKQLLARGLVAGTAEAQRLDNEITVLEAERGVYGGGEDGEPLRPELKRPTKEQMANVGGQHSLAASIKEGLEGRKRLEARLVNASRAENGRLTEELIAELRASRDTAVLAGLDAEQLAALVDGARAKRDAEDEE